MTRAKRKVYELEKSFFYRLRSKKKLAIFLNLDQNFFNGKSYKELIQYSPFVKKSRNIHNPKYDLKKMQRCLLRYLSRIETPEWLVSGKRGLSYIDNGSYHQSHDFVYTADIKKFYDSCKRKDIYKMFSKTFLMSPDVAGIMTDLVTYDKHLPTGSPTSQIIAYWAYRDVFLSIEKIAIRYNCQFTLYVDDMTFSSKTIITRKMINEIRCELKKAGLKLKESKTKYYGKGKSKLITGVVIDKNKIFRVPNKLRRAILHNLTEIKKLKGSEKIKKAMSVIGQIRTARQIEPNIFENAYNEIKGQKN